MKPWIYTLDKVKQHEQQNKFKVVSMFAGCGGSSTGYRLAGGHVLAVNEFIPEAQRVYKVNYPDTHIFPHDIRELEGDEILRVIGMQKGELDLLDGSPPCSSFSMMSGKRDESWGREKIYSDSKQRTDDLFLEYIRIINEIKPKVFIAENVTGLLAGDAFDFLGNGQSSLFGEQDNSFYTGMRSAGYNVVYKILNAADYMVPQARERLIFIGVREDIKIQPSYPQRVGAYVTTREALEGLPSEVIPTELMIRNEKKIQLFPKVQYGKSFEFAHKETFGTASLFSHRKAHPDEPCCTFTTHPDVYHWAEPRHFTISEIKRLCSFPDDYYVGDKYTKQYERLGRAVPPLMMAAVANHVYKTILHVTNNR